MVHELDFAVDWKAVPPCSIDDTHGPRFPLHILSTCAISGKDITYENAFDRERTDTEFPFVVATPKFVAQ
jgi:hypothetical protein